MWGQRRTPGCSSGQESMGVTDWPDVLLDLYLLLHDKLEENLYKKQTKTNQQKDKQPQ